MRALYEALLIFVLILCNGLFAMSEIAIVSAKRGRLAAAADRGSRGARRALELAAHPDQFLATVQIGITLIGIFAGAFGGATLAGEIGTALARFPALAPHAEALGLAIVVLAVSYGSLVLGELVPKRLALDRAERIAAAVAAPIAALARLATPAVALLRLSTRGVLRLLGLAASAGPTVTEEDIDTTLAEGTAHGALLAREHAMIDAILALDERRVATYMTPRGQAVSIAPDEPLDSLRRKIAESDQPAFPVQRFGSDDLLGFVTRRDLLVAALSGERVSLPALWRPVPIVPETLRALAALERLERARLDLLGVVDEHGAIQGFLFRRFLADALLAAGDASVARPAPGATRRPDGSWLIDGLFPVEEFAELFGLAEIPEAERGGFHTLAGLVLARLGRIPGVGDRLVYHGLEIEVVDMDGRRIDQLLVRPVLAPLPNTDAS